MEARTLALLGSAARGAWGLGAYATPHAMTRAQLTGGPDLDLPDPRLYVRGFGAHQVLIAGFTTFAATRSPSLLRPALALSALLDAVDIASAAAELRARRGADRTVVGGIVFSGGGLALSAGALRALRR